MPAGPGQPAHCPVLLQVGTALSSGVPGRARVGGRGGRGSW